MQTELEMLRIEAQQRINAPDDARVNRLIKAYHSGVSSRRTILLHDVRGFEVYEHAASFVTESTDLNKFCSMTANRRLEWIVFVWDAAYPLVGPTDLTAEDLRS